MPIIQEIEKFGKNGLRAYNGTYFSQPFFFLFLHPKNLIQF
jgi:hypothetical protein